MSRGACLVLTIVVAAACRHAPPTVSGGNLYANVHKLQQTGQAAIGGLVVRTDQTLVTVSARQPFPVAQVIEHCTGGDPTLDVDCMLALLLAERFTVVDHAPAQRGPAAKGGEDRSGSMLASAAVVGLALAAMGGLVYGVATCDFPGCKAVFGVPIVLVGGSALFVLGRD